jgi:hypothetical protein
LGSIGSFMFLVGSFTIVIGGISIDIGIMLILNVIFRIHQPKFFIGDIYVQGITSIVVITASITWIFLHGAYYYKNLISVSKKAAVGNH